MNVLAGDGPVSTKTCKKFSVFKKYYSEPVHLLVTNYGNATAHLFSGGEKKKGNFLEGAVML